MASRYLRSARGAEERHGRAQERRARDAAARDGGVDGKPTLLVHVDGTRAPTDDPQRGGGGGGHIVEGR